VVTRCVLRRAAGGASALAMRMALALLAVLAAGCCTMVRGRTVVVPVTSSPPGARATVDPTGQTLETPGAVVLERKQSYVVRLEKPGYQPASVALVSHTSWGLLRNLVWIHPAGWAIGMGVDLGNGAGDELVPDHVDAALAPAP
jgi:hypothetical protein